MHKLTFLAAALAAGMMSFAVTAEARDSTATTTRASPPKVAQAAKPCPYLFGCRKTEAKTTATSSVKSTRSAKSDRSGKARVAKVKSHRKLHRKTARAREAPAAVDNFTTASIGKQTTTATAGQKPYSAIIARYASAYGVPVSLAHAVIHVESNYQPNLTGSAGEVGLMQIKPATARMLGYDGSVKDLYNPETNIKYGMKYLAMAQELGNGTTCGTILKYNAGHAATRMNPVSSAYCEKVKVQLATLGSSV